MTLTLGVFTVVCEEIDEVARLHDDAIAFYQPVNPLHNAVDERLAGLTPVFLVSGGLVSNAVTIAVQ